MFAATSVPGPLPLKSPASAGPRGGATPSGALPLHPAMSNVAQAITEPSPKTALHRPWSPAISSSRRHHPDKCLAQGRGAVGDVLLAAHVLGAPRRCFDRDRRKTVSGQVVGAGAHVQLSGGCGEFEAVGDESGVDQRAQLVRPLVDVHRGVHAPRLFAGDLRLAAQPLRIAGRGRLGEEPVGVEVAAAQRHRFDHGIGARRPEPQRNLTVAHVGAAVDHRPLVQAEAVEPGRPPGGGLQQVGDELDGPDAGQQMLVGDGHGRTVLAVTRPPEESPGRLTAACDAVPGVPAAQLARLQAVVAEQEVPHRVSLAAPRPLLVWRDEAVHPLGVQPFPLGPLRLVENHQVEDALRHGGSRRERYPPSPRRGPRASPSRSPGHRRR